MYCRVIRRKFLAPSTISTSEILRAPARRSVGSRLISCLRSAVLMAADRRGQNIAVLGPSRLYCIAERKQFARLQQCAVDPLRRELYINSPRDGAVIIRGICADPAVFIPLRLADAPFPLAAKNATGHTEQTGSQQAAIKLLIHNSLILYAFVIIFFYDEDTHPNCTLLCQKMTSFKMFITVLLQFVCYSRHAMSSQP